MTRLINDRFAVMTVSGSTGGTYTNLGNPLSIDSAYVVVIRFGFMASAVDALNRLSGGISLNPVSRAFRVFHWINRTSLPAK